MSTQHTKVRLIQDILKDNVCRHPDKLALICENQRLTYSQIDEMSNRLAHALLKNGIQQGDRILLYLLNSAELVVSIFAALKARAVFSVIDYANTLESLNKIATDCDASVLITYSQLSESIGQLIQNIPSIRFAILTGKKADITTENIISYEAIQSDYCTDALPQNSIDCDLAYLLYTSGSTGKAKGVLTTHKSSLFTIESGVERFALCEDDIHALPLPISFAPGINQLLQIFRAGGTVILEKSFAFPNVILKKMATEKATGLGGVPTVLSQMMQLELSRYDLSSLRYIISSGAALSMATIKQIREKFPETLLSGSQSNR
jgi:acyl-CoA synthetase (AMP-forming)/AMP-acid ligase II